MIRTQTTVTILRRHIQEELLAGSQLELPDQVSLISGGILDSTALVGLAGFIEQRFAVEIPESAFTVDQFDTLESIAALIHRLQEEASGSPTKAGSSCI